MAKKKGDLQEALKNFLDDKGNVQPDKMAPFIGVLLEDQFERSCALLCGGCHYTDPIDDTYIHESEQGERYQCQAIILRANVRNL